MSDILGWFKDDEAEAIIRGARQQHDAGHLVEIGTWCGRSTSMLASGLPAWRIYTIDKYVEYPESFFVPNDIAVPKSERPQDVAARVLSPFKNVTAWVLDSADATLLWLQNKLPRVDCLFVDGDHTAEGALRDIDAWLPLMALHSVIYLHDANHWRFGEAIAAAEARSGLTAAFFRRTPTLEAGSLHAWRR